MATMSAAAVPAATMEEAPIQQLPFAHLPSVGTWLLPPRRPVREQAPPFEALEEVDFIKCRSVNDGCISEDWDCADDRESLSRAAQMSARVHGAVASVNGAVNGAVGRVVGAAEFGANVFCEKWQATDDAATRVFFASEEFISKRAEVISEVASEKSDRVKTAVTERARQGYAFAADKTRPIRQAAGYAKEKLEAASEAIHDKTAAGVHAGGKSAEKAADRFSQGCGYVAGKAENLSVSMAAKASRGMNLLSAKTAVVKQGTKMASWTTRASGA